jgi:epoxyqueuosine reductase
MLMIMTDKDGSPAALAARLEAALGSAGFRCRLAPVGVAEELGLTIDGLRDEGSLAESLYEEWEDLFHFTPPPEVPAPRTLIAVAWPSPAVKVRFQMDTGPLEAVIPPTYISSAGRERCLATMRSVLGPLGHVVARARIPVKLLAVRSGLARYGRNNLAYVRGMGTFARLDAFCTDADLEAVKYETKGSLRLSACPPCRNCHHVCPTGCIPYDGQVIEATRCLTYLNENEDAWPEWLDPRAHNSLVGCMRCQEMCPADRYYLRTEPVVAEFDEQETAIILENLPPERLPGPVLRKLKDLDMEEYSPILGRNLLALRTAAELRLTDGAD